MSCGEAEHRAPAVNVVATIKSLNIGQNITLTLVILRAEDPEEYDPLNPGREQVPNIAALVELNYQGPLAVIFSPLQGNLDGELKQQAKK